MDPTVEHEQLATRVSQELQVYMHKGLRDYLPGGRMLAFGCVGALLGLGGSVLVRPAQLTTQATNVAVAEATQQVVRLPVKQAAFLQAGRAPNTPPSAVPRTEPPTIVERVAPPQRVAVERPSNPVPKPRTRPVAATGLLVPPAAARRVEVPSSSASLPRDGLLIPPEFAGTLPGGH